MDLGSHPLNLALRFGLEIAVLVAAGVYGWRFPVPLRFVFVWFFPLLLIVVWGVFAVPKDPSRSGRAPVPVGGRVRLFLEFFIFTFGLWGLIQAGWQTAAWIFAVLVLLHYGLSLDRLRWLWRSADG